MRVSKKIICPIIILSSQLTFSIAKRVEANPNPTSTCDVVPETTTGMTPLNYDWSNSVSIISAAESVASTTTVTPLVMWSSPRHHLN